MSETPERIRFHEILRDFAQVVKRGSIVYDIGVSGNGNYSDTFPHCTYRTIDRAAKSEPDILCDVENVREWSPLCDALVCNGVTEQCDNPFMLARGAVAMMRKDALSLWGIMSVAYPIGKRDNMRFTPHGAARLLEAAGLMVHQESPEIVCRNGAPSYLFLIAMKR